MYMTTSCIAKMRGVRHFIDDGRFVESRLQADPSLLPLRKPAHDERLLESIRNDDVTALALRHQHVVTTKMPRPSRKDSMI